MVFGVVLECVGYLLLKCFKHLQRRWSTKLLGLGRFHLFTFVLSSVFPRPTSDPMDRCPVNVGAHGQLPCKKTSIAL